MGPRQTIELIAIAAQSIGQQAGVGAMETAGSIVSFLAAHPQHIDDFVAGKTSVLDWPIGWHEHGMLTWQGQNGRVFSPEHVRQHRVIKDLERQA